MKNDFTFIAVVLDRSGSMESVRADTIGGFNAFLRDQKAHPGEAALTLAQFDNEYEIVHDGKPLAEVPELTHETFVPRGGTALRDAIGRTINSVGVRLGAMSEEDRPSKVIVLILTDGHENASHEYSAEVIAQMIKTQREVYNWEFVYMGANQDAALIAKGFNIPAGNSSNYASNSAGTNQIFTTASAGLRAYRSRGSEDVGASFFDQTPDAKQKN